jgi:hypothetical protein
MWRPKRRRKAPPSRLTGLYADEFAGPGGPGSCRGGRCRSSRVLVHLGSGHIEFLLDYRFLQVGLGWSTANTDSTGVALAAAAPRTASIIG